MRTFLDLALAALAGPLRELGQLEFLSLLPFAAEQRVQYAGVNIAGFDFGCSINGTCDLANTFDVAGQGNGLQQMNHFVKDTGFNAFRLPVGWQFLVNNALGGPLDQTNFAKFDKLVQGCLNSSPNTICILDVHNYARFNGLIIGQAGGPSNDVFVNLWSQLATKYSNETRMVFGIMNEPHDIPDINVWAQTVQDVVTAIRKQGANQVILMPGNNFTSAAAFIDNGSAAALSKVKNPDGSITNLVFDVHRYLDQDNSGTHTECVTNNIGGAFQPLAEFLRQNNRKAFLTETGGGNTASCLKFLCEQLDFLNQNADVYLGWIGWAAGGFDQQYELVETPIVNGTVLTDKQLVTQCVAGRFKASQVVRRSGKINL